MTGRSPARFLSGLCMALVLAACGGGTGVDTASDDAAASAAQHASGTAQPGEGTTGAGTTEASPTGRGGAGDGSRGNPGGPGADPADGGGDATDVEAQGNPGAPGDVAVFEEAGVPYSVLKDDAAGRCADGVCTLLEPVVGAGNPDDLGGVDECVIQRQSDIRYDPPAEGGLFQRGATVQATVDCTTEDTGAGNTGAGESSTDGTQPADQGGPTSSGTSQDQVPADEPQG